MDYAVLLTDLTVPTREQLVAAFEHLPSLTRVDAIRRARQVCGFVAESLSHDDAMALLGGLAEQNLPAAIAATEELPVLAQPYRVRELRVEPEALTVFDVMQRPTELPWSAVQVLALGWVASTEFDRQVVGFERYGSYGAGAYGGVVEVVTETTERQNITPVLEIHLAAGAWGERSRLVAEGERIIQRRDARQASGSATQRYADLLRRLAGHASSAVVNRGMDGFVQRAEQVKYAARQVFDREIIWLKWLVGL